MKWKPWTLFALALAGWMSRQQQEVIAYLREENKILREKLGRKRILLSIEQKRRLATRGKIIGRDLLAPFGTLFSPDTILAWHLLENSLPASTTEAKSLGQNLPLTD